MGGGGARLALPEARLSCASLSLRRPDEPPGDWALGEDLGLGGLGTRGRGSGGGTRCVASGPLYVVNEEGRAWPIGEIAASDKAYTPAGIAAPGLSRVAIVGVAGLYPGPEGDSDWSFAVPSELLRDCPG